MKRVAIITSSDMGYQGKREDLNGPAIKEIAEREGYQAVSMDIFPDRMSSEWRKSQMRISRTDFDYWWNRFFPAGCYAEATEDITERKVPGIPEAIRASSSMTITKRAMLSRATAGIRKRLDHTFQAVRKQ